MADDRAKLGRHGEKLARRFLERVGHRIIAQNYRCPAGELDLITLDGETVVFVEVKTRRSEQAEDVERAVNSAKQRQLARVSRYYLTAVPAARQRPCRFDILAIVASPDGSTSIRHHPNAFAPPGRPARWT